MAKKAHFPGIGAFYAADLRRMHSPEIDFGVMWRMGHVRASEPCWRVSWVEATGEVYATNQRRGTHASLIVLGRVTGRESIEAALEGWANTDDWSISWVEAALDAAAAARLPDEQTLGEIPEIPFKRVEF